MRRLVITIVTTFAVAIAGTSFTAPRAAASDVAHNSVVSADPVDYTPHVLNGRVNAIAVVGDTVVVGGSFSLVREADGFFPWTRHNLLAFDAHTGAIKMGFVPRIDGPVHALVPGPGDTVFVGGGFTHVNGVPQRGLAQLHVSTGNTVDSFRGTSLDGGKVNALARHGRWLYVGGRFPGINGVGRRALARINVHSGEVDTRFAMNLAKPRRGTLSVKSLALSPDGSTLVIDGNFTRVAGQRRYQIAMIDTASRTPRLVNWATNAYTDPCMRVFHTYMRSIDFAPDGSYFVVVTAGGDVRDPTAMCDSAARWETAARGTNVRPTWVNRTGGDSLYAVAATGAAVYIGGHQRWVSNPRGNDDAGPGQCRGRASPPSTRAPERRCRGTPRGPAGTASRTSRSRRTASSWAATPSSSATSTTPESACSRSSSLRGGDAYGSLGTGEFVSPDR